MKQINDAGLKIIQDFESLRLTAYLDTGGVPTIGWGHTAQVKLGQTITYEKAVEFLRQDVKDAEYEVNVAITSPLTDNQFSALVSFVFNIGGTQFARSTMRRLLNAGKYQEAAEQFARWNKDNGKVLNGLIRRRKAERDLFLRE